MAIAAGISEQRSGGVICFEVDHQPRLVASQRRVFCGEYLGLAAGDIPQADIVQLTMEVALASIRFHIGAQPQRLGVGEIVDGANSSAAAVHSVD